MALRRSHIMLIGFKHVGKSVIGESLASRLNVSFIDLDREVEKLYENKTNQRYNCRQIMNKIGQESFRCFEFEALRLVVKSKPSIISLGGGAVLNPDSLRIIRSHTVIHIIAPQDIVLERIMKNGTPAFVNSEDFIQNSFNQLWRERMCVYETIQNYTIMNDRSVADAVDRIVSVANLGV